MADERAVSWQTWETAPGVKGNVQGNIDWGKLEISAGNTYYGPVVDSETTDEKRFTTQANKYGIGEGTIEVSIRGSLNIFGQHDISPDWEVYSTEIARVWRYIQIKIVFVA